MHGIFIYNWLMFMVNVGKYAIHGSYGYLFGHFETIQRYTGTYRYQKWSRNVRCEEWLISQGIWLKEWHFNTYFFSEFCPTSPMEQKTETYKTKTVEVYITVSQNLELWCTQKQTSSLKYSSFSTTCSWFGCHNHKTVFQCGVLPKPGAKFDIYSINVYKCLWNTVWKIIEEKQHLVINKPWGIQFLNTFTRTCQTFLNIKNNTQPFHAMSM